MLAFLWAGILVMGRDTIQSQVGPGELIPRLVIGLIAANFAIPLCSTIIGLANAFTAALTSQDITAPGSMQQLRNTTVTALSDVNAASAVGFLLLLIGLLIAVLTGTLLVQWIIRLGVLVVAVGIAPLALALHGTRQTEATAKLWWRTMLGTLGIVVIQAVALHTTLRVFLNPDSNLRVLGLPIPGGEPAAVMNLLIVVCLLFGVVKIPGLMGRYVTQSRPNAMSMILRVVLVQQLTRRISRVFGGGRSATRSAGRAGGGGGGTGADGVNRPWPVNSGGGGEGRTRLAPPSPTSRSAGSASRPLPRPAGAGSGRAGIAYPTGRPVRPYTREELARGVDLYTRAGPKRQAAAIPSSSRPPIRAAGVVPQQPRPGPPLSVSPGVTPATAMPRTRPVRQPVTDQWIRPARKS
ncbi:hypothetical protein ABZS66_59665 [Dactylosporangium sp. NPDC005572]|uniref:hypothetical protein n=1 Tax=Dactylosporangium sp. NPDC005572 TaxID=3156889 RepID=UPI0033ADE568